MIEQIAKMTNLSGDKNIDLCIFSDQGYLIKRDKQDIFFEKNNTEASYIIKDIDTIITDSATNILFDGRVIESLDQLDFIIKEQIKLRQLCSLLKSKKRSDLSLDLGWYGDTLGYTNIGQLLAFLDSIQLEDKAFSKLNYTSFEDGSAAHSSVSSSSSGFPPEPNTPPILFVTAESLEVTEDEAPTDSGLAFAEDSDGPYITYSVTDTQGKYGRLTIDSKSGRYTYVIDDDKLKDLDHGEKVSEEFIVVATDNAGGTDSEVITVTINGADEPPNEPPSLSLDSYDLNIVEDRILTDNGQATAIDDNPGVVFSIENGQGKYGILTIDPNTGKYSYNADNNKLQPLKEGEKTSESFTIVATDSDGAVDKENITVFITGVNEEPVLSLSTGNLSVTEDDVLIDRGQASATDDRSGKITYDVENGQGQYGVLTVDSNTGQYTYTADNNKLQPLNNNDHPTESFVITATDQDGGKDRKIVTVTINGVDEPNNPPILSLSTDNLNIKEESILTDSGQASATDDMPGVTFSIENGQGKYGILTIDSNTGQYTYTADNNKLQPLKEGEQKIETFMVVATDSDGVTDKENVKVFITGVNEEPILSLGVGRLGTNGLSVTEDDVLVDSAQATVQDDNPVGISYRAESNQGQYGEFTIDSNTGRYTYTADNIELQPLKEGQQKIEKFVIVVTDSDGGEARKTVEVTIHGANEPPALSLSKDSLNITEDDILIDKGQASVTDDDTGSIFSIENGQGKYGILTIDANTGEYTYTADNDKLQPLDRNETDAEKFIVKVTDRHGASDTKEVTINLAGAFEDIGPQVTFTRANINIEEDRSASGKTVVIDDLATTLTVDTEKGNYGSFSFFPSGIYIYSADIDKTRHLRDGETVTETFAITATATDGRFTTKNVIITIHGNSANNISNDEPVSFQPPAVFAVDDSEGTKLLKDDSQPADLKENIDDIDNSFVIAEKPENEKLILDKNISFELDELAATQSQIVDKENHNEVISLSSENFIDESVIDTDDQDVTLFDPENNNEGHIFYLTKNVSQHEEIQFNPDQDVFNLGNIKIDELKVYEQDNSTILELPGTDQSYTLKDVSLNDLETSDFVSNNPEILNMLDNIFEPVSGF